MSKTDTDDKVLDGFTIDFDNRSISLDGVKTKFGPAEFHVLVKLLNNFGSPCDLNLLYSNKHSHWIDGNSLEQSIKGIKAKVDRFFKKVGGEYGIKIVEDDDNHGTTYATISLEHDVIDLAHDGTVIDEKFTNEPLVRSCSVNVLDPQLFPREDRSLLDLVERVTPANLSNLFVLPEQVEENESVDADNPFSSLTVNFNEQSMDLEGEVIKFENANFATLMTLIRQEQAQAQSSSGFDVEKTPYWDKLSDDIVQGRMSLLQPDIKQLCQNMDLEVSIQLRYSWNRKNDTEGTYEKIHSLAVKPKDVDTSKYQFEVDGHILELRYEEHKALNLLSRNFNGIVRKADFGLGVEDNLVADHISTIRKHFKKSRLDDYLEIKNIRGKGYSFKFKNGDQDAEAKFPALVSDPYREQRQLFLQAIIPQLPSGARF